MPCARVGMSQSVDSPGLAVHEFQLSTRITSMFTLFIASVLSWAALGTTLLLGQMPPAIAITSVATSPSCSDPLGVLPPVIPAPTIQTSVSATPTSSVLPRGLILSPASDPIPSQLVQRIRSGEFVEMRTSWQTTWHSTHNLRTSMGQSP